MIDKLHSREREVLDAHDFKVNELYLQHCQQYEGKDSSEDILRIFRVNGDAVFGIENNHNILTLMNQAIYITNLDSVKFDKGKVDYLDNFKISFEDYMGHFYHIPNGHNDIEELFGVHLREHERMEKSTSSMEKIIA